MRLLIVLPLLAGFSQATYYLWKSKYGGIALAHVAMKDLIAKKL